jgi:hypothetical protein
MFYLLLMFSLVTLGAGVFLMGLGLPIRETVLGSALLVSATVALVGTFILIGLAVAVRELQRVVHGVRRMPRPPRPAERKDGERLPSSQRPASHRASADAPIPPPTSIDEPPYGDHEHGGHGEIRADHPAEGIRDEPRPDARPNPPALAPAGRPGPAWLRRAISEIEQVPGEPAPPERPIESRPPDPRHHDKPRRHGPGYGPGDVPFGRPAAGPERSAIQEGRLRPRAGAPAPIEPDDYAPEPDLPSRPHLPPAAQFDPTPAHEHAPGPLPDFGTRPRMPPAPQLEPPQGYDREPETLPDFRTRPRIPPAAQFEPPPRYEYEAEPQLDPRSRPRMPPAPQLEPAPPFESEPELLPDPRMRQRIPPPPQPEPVPEREPEPPRQAPALPPNLFDTVWPSERRRPANAEPQPEPQPPPTVRPGETRPLPPVQPVPMPGPASAPPMAAPRPEPPRPEPPRPEPPRFEQRPEPHRSDPSRIEQRPEAVRPESLRPESLRPESLRPEPRAVSVLKSGVIDEMAYTLFTDGSIEAQMPEGTMRFSSIEELRHHLDQNG